jgi:phage terminase small subunit
MPRANLTARQSAFIREYLVDFNGAQAARHAGYSERSAAGFRGRGRQAKRHHIRNTGRGGPLMGRSG